MRKVCKVNDDVIKWCRGVNDGLTCPQKTDIYHLTNLVTFTQQSPIHQRTMNDKRSKMRQWRWQLFKWWKEKKVCGGVGCPVRGALLVQFQLHRIISETNNNPKVCAECLKWWRSSRGKKRQRISTWSCGKFCLKEQVQTLLGIVFNLIWDQCLGKGGRWGGEGRLRGGTA